MESKNRLIRTVAVIGILVMVIVTVLPGCNFIGQSNKMSDSGALVDAAGNELCCPVCKSIDIGGPDTDGYYICNACGQKWAYDNAQINVVDASGNVVSTMDASAGYVSSSNGGGSGSGTGYNGSGSDNGAGYNGSGSDNGNGYNGSGFDNGSGTGGNNTSGGNINNGGYNGGSGSNNNGSGSNGGSSSSGSSSGNGYNGGSVNGGGYNGGSGTNNGTGNGTGGNSSSGKSTYTTNKNTPAEVKSNLALLKDAFDNFGKAVNITYNPKNGEYTVINPDGVDTGLFGYKYSDKDKIFFTAEESWQRNFGFNEVYDDAAAVGFMTYNTFRVYYEYDNLEWMIQFWKGQYGYAFIGSEIGVYTRPKGSGNGSTHYQCADDDHKFYMTMNVYRQDPDNKNKYNPVFTRSRSKTWWCTGFVPGTLAFAKINVPDEDGTATLKVDSRIEFYDEEMAQAFINGVKQVKYLENNAALAGTKRSVSFVECASEAEYNKCASSNKFCLCKNKYDGEYRDVKICYR